MAISFKKLLFTTLALIATLTLLVPQVFANHAWANYHWARTTSSFDLQLVNSMSGDWQPALSGAISDWSTSSVLNLIEVQGGGKRTCQGKNGVIEACNAKYGNTGWLGIAQIWVSGDHITKGTAKMNDTYFNTPPYNTAEWKNMVVCQEIAHAFGLGHQDENFNNANLNTCMDYTNDPTSNQHPNQHDFDMLETIYGHLDSFDSYVAIDSGSGDGGGTGNGGGKGGGKGKPSGVGQEADPTDQASWGKAVAYDAQNNPSVYVRDLGNNEMIVTHVTWIEDHSDHDHSH